MSNFFSCFILFNKRGLYLCPCAVQPNIKSYHATWSLDHFIMGIHIIRVTYCLRPGLAAAAENREQSFYYGCSAISLKFSFKQILTMKWFHSQNRLNPREEILHVPLNSVLIWSSGGKVQYLQRDKEGTVKVVNTAHTPLWSRLIYPNYWTLLHVFTSM